MSGQEQKKEKGARAKNRQERREKFRQRRRAREWALTRAYALLQGGEEPDPGAAPFGEDEADLLPPGDGQLVLTEALLGHIEENRADLDALLEPALDHWKLDRLTKVDHLLMHLALAELRLFPETPYRVILNEYIEIAKEFGTIESPKFVNGVLDRLARTLRPSETDGESNEKEISAT